MTLPSSTRTVRRWSHPPEGGAGDAGALVLRGRRVLLDGAFRPAAVWVEGGLVVRVGEAAEATGNGGVDVPDDAVLLPGLVDTHVHVNEPGRTHWEGFRTATRAAAAGGVTTVLDMPLNSIPVTTTLDALTAKRTATAGKLAVDVGFWGGAVPENLGSLGPLARAGVFGFKCFLAPSGIDEFGHLGRAELNRALAEVAALGTLLVVHAEDPSLLHGGDALGPRYADFVASRPARSEESAIAAVIEGVRATGARAHIVHLSDAGSLPLIRAAKAEGLPLTVETCPHYLTLLAEDVPDSAPAFKACPPIRDQANRDGLWAGVLDGTIDAIVSDHSPSTLEMKNRGAGDFGLAWGGIAGLQLGLAAVWTQARARGVPLAKLMPLFTTGPARIARLAGLGEIRPGAPAHLVVFRPDAPFGVHAPALEHRNPISPWDGAELTGVVDRTYLRGALAWSGAGVEHPRLGRLLHARAGRTP